MKNIAGLCIESIGLIHRCREQASTLRGSLMVDKGRAHSPDVLMS